MDKVRIEEVQTHYDADPAQEWERLGEEKNWEEFFFTTHMMDQYIRPGDSVLDIGGGPGRYALHYAQRGCAVTLADLSQGNVDFAKAKAKELGVDLTAYAANCLELDTLGLPQFDHVFLMGPLYHLLVEGDRVQAVEAALRRLKKGGKLYVAFIPTTSGPIYCLQHPDILVTAQDNPDDLRNLAAIGAGEDFAGRGFTQVYSFALENILPFMEQFGLKKLHFFPQEGFLAPNKLELRRRSGEEQGLWRQLALDYLERPEFLSWGEHIMYIGEKE